MLDDLNLFCDYCGKRISLLEEHVTAGLSITVGRSICVAADAHRKCQDEIAEFCRFLDKCKLNANDSATEIRKFIKIKWPGGETDRNFDLIAEGKGARVAANMGKTLVH